MVGDFLLLLQRFKTFQKQAVPHPQNQMQYNVWGHLPLDPGNLVKVICPSNLFMFKDICILFQHFSPPQNIDKINEQW